MLLKGYCGRGSSKLSLSLTKWSLSSNVLMSGIVRKSQFRDGSSFAES